MPRFTTASATRSSSARSSIVDTSAPDLVEKAWESSARTLSNFSARVALEKEIITVWKGAQNLLSSALLYGGAREESMKVWRQGVRSFLCFRSAHPEKVKPQAGHVLPCVLSLESTHATTSPTSHVNWLGNCFTNAVVNVSAMTYTCCRIIGQVAPRCAYSFPLYWLICRTWWAPCAAIRPRTVSFGR